MIKIMFVCHGNICRSPMAEFIMKDIARKNNDTSIIISSSATSTEEIGNDMYYESKKILDKYHIKYKPRQARRFTIDDYNDFNYIIIRCTIIGCSNDLLFHKYSFLYATFAAKFTTVNSTALTYPFISFIHQVASNVHSVTLHIFLYNIFYTYVA